jgi:hypothetical protein
MSKNVKSILTYSVLRYVFTQALSKGNTRTNPYTQAAEGTGRFVNNGEQIAADGLPIGYGPMGANSGTGSAAVAEISGGYVCDCSINTHL